jgi:GAF domain-containing protein
MGQRRFQRLKMVLPVRIAGRDVAGNAFSLLSHTLDFSRHGARLGGVQASLQVGDEITVDYKRRRGPFKVRWVDAKRRQVGIENLDPEGFVFVELPPEQYVDDVDASRFRKPQEKTYAAPATPGAAAASLHPGKNGNAVQPPAQASWPEHAPAFVQPISSAVLVDLTRKLQDMNDDTDGALQLVADTTRELIPASGAAVALASGNDWICRASSGVAPRVGVHFRCPQGLTGETVRSGRIVICRDTEAESHVNASVWRAVRLRSAASIPLISNTQVVGVLEVFAEGPNAFGDEQGPLLQGLGDLLAKVVANVIDGGDGGSICRADGSPPASAPQSSLVH